MDKLRKIGLWLWYNKERMVLIVMVVLLAYRVYGIMYPAPQQTYKRIPQPQLALPEDGEERKDLGLPSAPPIQPPTGVPGTYTSLFERNPFWYYSSQAKQEQGETVQAADLNIKLVDIQDVGGKPRARLRTSSTTKWYSEGEQFEEFELVEINPVEKTVVIYSERYSRQFTLEKQ
jgi:hypothetical protein